MYLQIYFFYLFYFYYVQKYILMNHFMLKINFLGYKFD